MYTGHTLVPLLEKFIPISLDLGMVWDDTLEVFQLFEKHIIFLVLKVNLQF
jgi:hypothetical protein